MQDDKDDGASWMIEQGIADGGMPYPEIPGIEEALATIPESGDAETTDRRSSGQTNASEASALQEMLVATMNPAATNAWVEQALAEFERALAFNPEDYEVRAALARPKPRKKTRPSRRAVEKRLAAKRRRADVKKDRGPVRDG